MTVSQWLGSLPNIKGVRGCRVVIGKETFEGAFYTQVNKYIAGMDCVRNGTHKAGEEYEQTAIYVVGKRPKPSRCCFPFKGQDWYVACYADPNKPIAPEHQRHHPFGYNFVVMPWSAPNSTIDQYESKPYRRIPMSVEWSDTE